MIELFKIHWNVHKKIKAYTSLRGLDCTNQINPYSGLNLATHVGDDVQIVKTHRNTLKNQMGWHNEPKWLNQTHSTKIVLADEVTSLVNADGSYTQQNGIVCVVLTADCLPVFIADPKGACIGVFHAGWRGLADGVLEVAVKQLQKFSNQLVAAIGPAISSHAFEIGSEVRDQFLSHYLADEIYFKPSARAGHYYADLFQLAKRRLLTSGVIDVQFPGSICTYNDAKRFYSYRRQGQCGRMASFIWLES